jgi:hypothetical protein
MKLFDANARCACLVAEQADNRVTPAISNLTKERATGEVSRSSSKADLIPTRTI